MASYAAIPDELSTGFGQDGDPTMPNFWERCKALDGGNGSLYFNYQILTEAVHPSAGTLLQHLDADEEGVKGVKFGVVLSPPPDMWAACATSAFAAAITIASQREGQPKVQAILDLFERHQVPCDLSAREPAD